MTLAKKIEMVLKDELQPENIKTVIDMVEFLKLKEKEVLWDKINEGDSEYLSEEEYEEIERGKLKGKYIEQDSLLKELGISKDEI